MHNCEVIAIANQKGGVGKTTTAFNLGVALANQGKNVLLIDSDPQGDLTVSMGFKENEDFKYKLSDLLNCYLKKIDVSVDNFIITHKEGVDLIPSNLDLSAMEMNIYNSMNRERIFSRCLKNLRNRYDYILIDCQPSLSMLTINALAFADKVVIPVQSQYLAAKNTSQLLEIIGGIKEELNEDLTIGGILITLVDKRTNLSKKTLELLADSYGSFVNIYNTQIPISTKIAEATSQGESIFKYDKNNKSADAYFNFSKEIIDNDKERTRNVNTKDFVR